MAIAAILAVILIAAAVWYFVFYQKQANVNPGSKPTVSYGYLAVGGPSGNHHARWNISAASEGLAFSLFNLSLAMDGGQVGSTQPLVADVTISFGSAAEVTVHDLDGDGELTIGDEFLAQGMSGVHTWNLTLLWNDDNPFTWMTWATWAVSPITFTIQSAPSLWIMHVTDPPAGGSLSWVRLTIKNRSGAIVPPMDSVPLEDLTAGNFTTYGVLYARVRDEGVVRAGANINVSKTMYPSGFTYEVTDGYIALATGVFRYESPVILYVVVRTENWTISVTGAPDGLPLNGTFLTITNDSGIRAPMDSIPLSNLTTANWGVYGAEYRKVGVEDDVDVGASINVSRTDYPPPCQFTVSDGWETLGTGDLIGPYLEFQITITGRNFTMTVTAASPGLALSSVEMTIEDTMNNVKLNSAALSDLTTANWGTNKAIYQKIGTETDVVVGASISVDKASYYFCYKYFFVSGMDALAQGTFFNCSLMLGIISISAGTNWTLIITSVPTGLTNLAIANVTLTISDVNHDVQATMDSVPLSFLTMANWSIYFGYYARAFPGDTIVTIGAGILASKSAYLSGFYWELLTADRALAIGRFM
jgi:hypothetical protein